MGVEFASTSSDRRKSNFLNRRKSTNLLIEENQALLCRQANSVLSTLHSRPYARKGPGRATLTEKSLCPVTHSLQDAFEGLGPVGDLMDHDLAKLDHLRACAAATKFMPSCPMQPERLFLAQPGAADGRRCRRPSPKSRFCGRNGCSP